MNKFKNFLSSLGILTIIMPIAISVSCGGSFLGDYTRSGGKIALITDSGSVKDKSFNEFIFKGVENYSIKAKNDLNIVNKSYSYIQPQTIDKGVFQKSYQYAIDEGAEVLVLPGFHHSAEGVFSEVASKNRGTAFIGIDTWGHGPNVQNLAYSTEQSAFLAAVYTGIYMNKIKPSEIVGEFLKVSTFEGAVYTAVTAYMDGWLQGIKFFNDMAKESNKHSNEKKYKLMEQVFVEGNQPSKSDFSQDFNPGSATDLSKRLINNGAQVVMAVAGPQTADFIGAALSTGRNNIYAIGVDTDQSQAYDPTLMIGSALKGIDLSTTLALEDLFNSNGTKIDHGINSGNIEFKETIKQFDYNSIYVDINKHEKHVVDFAPSRSIRKIDDEKIRGTGEKHSNPNPIYLKAIQKLSSNDSGILNGTANNRLRGNKLPEGVKWGYNEVNDNERGK